MKSECPDCSKEINITMDTLDGWLYLNKEFPDLCDQCQQKKDSLRGVLVKSERGEFRLT